MRGHTRQTLQGFSTRFLIAALGEGKIIQGYDGRWEPRTAYVHHYTTPDIHRLACQGTHDDGNQDIDIKVLQSTQ